MNEVITFGIRLSSKGLEVITEHRFTQYNHIPIPSNYGSWTVHMHLSTAYINNNNNNNNNSNNKPLLEIKSTLLQWHS